MRCGTGNSPCRERRPLPGFARQVVNHVAYDWEGDAPLNHLLEDSVIYEVHVGGFTRHASARVGAPGTFNAIIEKIPYLQSLGITDVELMPVMAFDTQDVPPVTAALGLSNFWGYSPYGFFAPHPPYCVTPDGRREFRDMVKALHRAGIGVILDVVFNHTAEGGEDGPIISFKGFGNEIFYHLDPADRRRYRDFSGCGNTVNCNHPLVARYIVQCLEYWVREMHVDGFRFDLASVLARGEDGRPMYHAPGTLEHRVLRGRSLTRASSPRPGTPAGSTRWATFPGFRWAEWNGRYRDSVRRFVRGDVGLVGEIAYRVVGQQRPLRQRRPAAHQQHQLRHLSRRLHAARPGELQPAPQRRQRRGQSRRDGGELQLELRRRRVRQTTRQVLALRRRLARNHLAVLMLSQGVPMLLAGDEVLRTQRGNNNAYCQDNEIAWFDWSLVERHADFLRYTRELIRLRRRHSSLRRAALSHRRARQRPGRDAGHPLARGIRRHTGLDRPRQPTGWPSRFPGARPRSPQCT